MIFWPKNYTVLRYANPTNIKGEMIKGTETSIIISANIQPLTAEELNSLEIGRRELGKIKIYSDFDLKVSETKEDGTLIDSDKIIWDNGKKYEIIMKMDYNEQSLIPHKKYIAELRENL